MFISMRKAYCGAVVIFPVVVVDDRVEGKADVVEQAVVRCYHGIKCKSSDMHQCFVA